MAFLKFIAFIALGLLLLAAGLLLPAHVRSVDQQVLQAASGGGMTVERKVDLLAAEARVGPVRLIAEGGDLQLGAVQEQRVADLLESRPLYRVTGGPEPYLEDFFAIVGYNPDRPTPEGIVPALIPEIERRSLADFLSTSTNSNVQAVLAARTADGLTRLRPAGSGAGAPYDAAMLVLALLIEGNHLPSEMAADLGAVAAAAADGNVEAVRMIEDAAISLITLGRRLDFQQLAAVAAACGDRGGLVAAARLVRGDPDKLAFFSTAVVLSGDPVGIARYLRGPGEGREAGLGVAVPLGGGAIDELIARDLPLFRPSRLAAPVLDALSPLRPPGLAGFALSAPLLALVARFALFVGAGLMVAFAVAALWRSEKGVTHLERSNPIVLTRDALVALTLAVVLWAVVEPDILRAVGDRTEPGMRLEFAAAGAFESLESPLKSMQEINEVTLLVLALFFVLQLIIDALCLIKVREIRRQQVSPELRLQLLENEDYLFDFGLYVGLGGTVASLILVAIGIVEASLMAAYASTLFGILFVALLKIFHVRPFRRKLILEAGAKGGHAPAIPSPDNLMKDAVL